MGESVNLLFEKEVSVNALRTNAVFGEEGIMSSMYEGYKPRTGQISAIPLIWDGMSEDKHCIIEGPCGFGKTFAYLFPTMMEVAESGKRAVIATSGITLQDQLYRKDAPFIANVIKEYTGHELSIGYLKGRQNYICNRKIAELVYNKANGVYIDGEIKYEPLIGFYNETKTGDKDELDYVPDFNIWSSVACNKDDCEGKNCSFKQECFYHKAKAQACNKQIIITNYHILLSDKLIGGSLLGKYDILVCDEAHELPNIIRDYYESKFSTNTLIDLKRKSSLLKQYGDMVDIDMVQNKLALTVDCCTEYIGNVTTWFNYMKPNETALVDANIEGKLGGWSTAKKSLDEFSSFLECYMDEYTDDSEESQNIFSLLSNLNNSTRSASKTLEATAGGYISVDDDSDNVVRYIEMGKNNKIELKNKYKKVGHIFDSMFSSRQVIENDRLSILLTSATISVNGSFSYIKDQLGIKESYDTVEYVGESPFDLSSQEIWYLPPNAKNGNEQQFNTRMLQDFLEVVVSCNGGVLGLFTSIYNMRAASKFLHENLPSNTTIDVMTQGDMPREKLINSFKYEHNSVLIGTKSLFTGVDVPGDSLRCVFIDKLPFPNMADPVQQALGKEPGSFFKYSIPNMIIDLKQAVGRGVRSIDDKCVVVIADNRMSTSNYKQQIFNSFNYKKLGTRNIHDVINFLERN